MSNINNILEEKDKCYGCNACYNICPVEAIEMVADEEGFLYPNINTEKCTNCGLCKKVCPSLNKSEKFNTNTNSPKCYAVMASDEIRTNSTSGGAFSLFANWILEQGGYVCGAAFDDNGKVEHIIINYKEELNKLQSSKYVQSDMNYIHKQLKTLLNEGKIVLFSGTPCQVAGVNNFIGKNDNLYTIDLICHGVPSPLVWMKYLKETIGDEKFIYTKFREKILPYGNNHLITYTDKNIYSFYQRQDSYLKAFHYNMILRPSCHKCAFTTVKRNGDISIGDFWGIDNIDKSFNDTKGTSLVLINSKNGKNLFKAVQKNTQKFKAIHYKHAIPYNHPLSYPIPEQNKKYNYKVIEVNILKDKYNSIEDWLYLIKNCELVVTNSFHGLCLALIFNKPFVIHKNPKWDNSRCDSILSTLNLENRLLISLDNIEKRQDIFEPIDWEKVNSVLASEKERCLKWLKEALESEKDTSKISPEDALIKLFRDKIAILESDKIDKSQLSDIINHKKIHGKYLKYKILKNITFGKIKENFQQEYEKYSAKVKRNNQIINKR